MRVLVILLDQHRLALKTFAARWENILGEGLVPRLFPEFSFAALSLDPSNVQDKSVAELIEIEYTKICEPNSGVGPGLVVLYEEQFRGDLSGIRDAVFAGEIEKITFIENVQNFLIEQFTRLLGNYSSLVRQVQDSNKRQAASLPLRNFRAKEFSGLVELCREGSMDADFHNAIAPQLKKLMRLRGPKRRSSYPHVYFKDEHSRFFKFGHERHSQYETGGVHNAACRMNGALRFGSFLDQERHYNVSVGDSDANELISCRLPNCHGEVVDVHRRLHINMFSNDFHK